MKRGNTTVGVFDFIKRKKPVEPLDVPDLGVDKDDLGLPEPRATDEARNTDFRPAFTNEPFPQSGETTNFQLINTKLDLINQRLENIDRRLQQLEQLAKDAK